jgi:UPF0716 family protein affecting phage T7 exclusion
VVYEHKSAPWWWTLGIVVAGSTLGALIARALERLL